MRMEKAVERTGLLGRLRAAMHGEVSIDALLAYRRAGNTVYDMLKHVEDKRLELKINGVDPWDVEQATQAELLCAWNAFILQTLGDQFLDADEHADPATAGFVPPVTAEQVMRFYHEVEPWLSRARQAHENTSYRLDVHVPATLPPWVEVEPCPGPHLDALLATAQAVRNQAEAALGVFVEAAKPEHQSGTQRVRQLMAAAASKTDYAQQLWSGHVSQQLHEQIERGAKEAMESYYQIGQILAMPTLLDAPAQPVIAATTAAVRPGPGQSGFDPWCLTDPYTRATWQRDRRARDAIANLWRYDPDPRRTIAIQAAIDAALERGDIGYATDGRGEPLGNYFCCPWSAIYVAKRPVTLADRRLRPLQEFTYDVSAEGVLQGEPFKRDILVARFQSSNDVDYCDPTERD